MIIFQFSPSPDFTERNTCISSAFLNIFFFQFLISKYVFVLLVCFCSLFTVLFLFLFLLNKYVQKGNFRVFYIRVELISVQKEYNSQRLPIFLIKESPPHAFPDTTYPNPSSLPTPLVFSHYHLAELTKYSK